MYKGIMKLLIFTVEKFRSIEHVEVRFPDNKPLIFFGPNNAGKSNILKALDCFLGEKYTTYIDFQDSDYFFRNKEAFPNIRFIGKFDADIYPGNSRSSATNELFFTTNIEINGDIECCYHKRENTTTGQIDKIYLTNESRHKCQFILVDATRDIERQLSYFSKYSILSKMAKRMHDAIGTSVKEELNNNFTELKSIFETVPEYKTFLLNLQNAFDQNVDGFEHKLEIDLSAYDPNNYFHSLRIVAKEGTEVRSFDEFGTGEKQILLISFVKAYAETFSDDSFILAVEEPEAHLHPLAQRWFSNKLNTLTGDNIQVVITTHSPEFLSIDNLEGFVRVYKDAGITKVIQHTAKSLADFCISNGAPSSKVKESNILNFYETKTFYDQLKGFFARKVILVEGDTELFALPNYFKNWGYSLLKDGVDIVNCRGKGNITRNYRLYKAFGYKVYCLFDADGKSSSEHNQDLSVTFGFELAHMNLSNSGFTADSTNGYGYFGKDFETYMTENISDYRAKASKVGEEKVLVAKIVSESNDYKPMYIEDIASYFLLAKVEDR